MNTLEYTSWGNIRLYIRFNTH